MTETRKPPQLLQIQERSETPAGYACPLCGAPIIIMAASAELIAGRNGTLAQIGAFDWSEDSPGRCSRFGVSSSLQQRPACIWRGSVKEAALHNYPKV